MVSSAPSPAQLGQLAPGPGRPVLETRPTSPTWLWLPKGSINIDLGFTASSSDIRRHSGRARHIRISPASSPLLRSFTHVVAMERNQGGGGGGGNTGTMATTANAAAMPGTSGAQMNSKVLVRQGCSSSMRRRYGPVRSRNKARIARGRLG
jgi:hypothetical protein